MNLVIITHQSKINVTSGDSFYVSPSKHFLVYESGSNRWRFKRPNNLTGSLDYFMNQSGSLITITHHQIM